MNEPKEILCPLCRRYLGTIAGEYFRAPPCQCGWQLQLVKVRKLPRNIDRIEVKA